MTTTWMLYTTSSTLTALLPQMGVTDYTAEDKFSVSSCTDLGSDGGNCMGICLMEVTNSGMQLNDQSLEATAQAKEQRGWGSEEPAATSCIHVSTLAT